MKRRDFLKSAGIATAASAIAAPAIAQSTPELRWRMALSWPKSLDTLYGGCEVFAKRVAELTDNRFQIQLFAAGEIVPGLQVLDAVQHGSVEMGNTAGYYYWGKDPAFTFSTTIPFGLNTRQAEAWHYHGGGQELLNDSTPSIIAMASQVVIRARRWAVGFERNSILLTTSRVSRCASAALRVR